MESTKNLGIKNRVVYEKGSRVKTTFFINKNYNFNTYHIFKLLYQSCRIVHQENPKKFSSLSIYLSITLYHLFSLLLPFNHLS